MDLELLDSTILAAILVAYFILAILSIYGKRYYYMVFCMLMIAHTFWLTPPGRKIPEENELILAICMNSVGLLMLVLIALFLWYVFTKEKKSFENAGK